MNFIEDETPTKLRGGYYTDPQIALFLTRWVAEIKPQRILEPSCGDGVFFDAVALCQLRSLEYLAAFELDPGEATAARMRLARRLPNVRSEVFNRDFLSWSIAHLFASPEFDAVVGNPPFIRYQYLAEAQQLRAQKIFEYFRLPFTKHTNAWVPFVISSIAHLKPSGRLAMVVPSEILHVLHAQSLRSFLISQCSKIVVIDPTDLWFNETLQGVVLLLAEKAPFLNGPPSQVAIVEARDRRLLDKDPGDSVERADFISGHTLPHKWMPALLTSKERDIVTGSQTASSVARFKDLADVDVGIVTGANKFFLVPDATVRQFNLQRWAHPMFGRSEHVAGVIYDRRTHNNNRKRGLPTNFVWFRESIKTLPAGPRRYIAEGERQKLAGRYKCRVREPWYTVPSVYAAPVGMLKRAHDFPRLILNKMKAFSTDTAYRIRPTRVPESTLVFSFVNSLTMLSAELEGRHYGGGVLELVPSEIERLLVPAPIKLRPKLGELDEAFRKGIPPRSILETQDNFVLDLVGLSRDSRQALASAWFRLRSRRQRSRVDEDVAVEPDA